MNIQNTTLSKYSMKNTITKLCFSFLLLFCCGMHTILRARNTESTLWQLQTSDMHSPYVGAPMANGRIGILPWREPFSGRHVILNHVFDTDGPQGVSRVLKGINPFLLSMEADGKKIDARSVSHWEQMIDMKEATHNTRFLADRKVEVSYSLCALRNMPYAGLIRVELNALADITLKFSNRMDIPQEYTAPVKRFRRLMADHTEMHMLQAFATSRYKHRQVSASSTFLFDKKTESLSVYEEKDEGKGGEMSFTVALKKGDRFSFALVASICSDRDFSDPYNEAERQVIYAAHEGANQLMNAHRHLWNELWQGDVCIEGDDDAQRAVRFALFNLYSFAGEGSGLSISPMGLSSQGYNGHIFWDAELWMFPPVLLLNQGMAASMLDYRIHRLPAACKKAKAYGCQGAMFPWESDDEGEESTPTTALTGPFEHHITADIGIACWNYYCVTRNSEWLKQKGFPLMKAVADFWVSRAVRNEDGSYSVRNVTGADEYANNVDDNAFTNAAARRALEYACKAAALCGEPVPAAWQTVGNNLRMLRFENGVTREHASYRGEMIKQADVNLLGYPLGLVNDPEILKKDMEYYAERIDPKDGPAMSYSVFCVQYARMGEARRAYEMFKRCYQPNLRAPFGVLAETSTGNNPYFATGAGGLLQAVINGFCGLQITENGIVRLPSVLPAHWKKVTVTGVGPEKKTYERSR